MNRKTHGRIQSRLMLAILGGSIGVGTIALLPAPALAIEETVKVDEAKVPAPVLATARTHHLEATDVAYRVSDEGKKIYQVNYTIPGNVRLQMLINADGSIAQPPKEAPNQPNNAAKNKDRDEIVARWNAHVQEAARQRELAKQPPERIPGGNRPLALPPEAPPPATAEIPASQLPAAVAETFQRSARGARDVRYYRLADGNQATYQMLYTTENGTRREMTLNELGREIADPRTARRAQQDGGVTERWEDLPQAVQKSMLPIVGRDRDAKYYRQVQDGRVSYGSIYKDNGREMWVRVAENGDIIVNPVSADTGRRVDDRAQPAADRLSPEMLRDRVNFVDLPKPVQKRVLDATDGAKDVVNMIHREGNRVVHHTSWTDSRGNRQELWLDERGEPVRPLNRAN